MTVPNDSALLHGAVYDPAKARAYYLRTRQLKGRPKGSGRPVGQPQATLIKDKSGSSRQKEISAKQAALKGRLDRLRDVLAKLVEQAKGRSGAESSDNQNVSPTDQAKETASKNESNKKSTPLTSAQKKKKAAKARADYQKQDASPEVKQLQRQIKDIREKIQKAIEDSRKLSAQSKLQTATKGR